VSFVSNHSNNEGTINTEVDTEGVPQNIETSPQIMQLNVGTSPTTSSMHQAYYSPVQKKYVILPRITQTPGQGKTVYKYQTAQTQQKAPSLIYDLLNVSKRNNTNIVNSTQKQLVLSSPQTIKIPVKSNVYQVRCNQSPQHRTSQITQTTTLNTSSPALSVTSMNSTSHCSEEQVPSQIIDHGYAVGSPHKVSQFGNSSNRSVPAMQVLNLNHSVTGKQLPLSGTLIL